MIIRKINSSYNLLILILILILICILAMALKWILKYLKLKK
jgi:hypothetical protein